MKIKCLFPALLLFFGLCLPVLAQEVEVYPQLGHSGYINSVAFSPDGKLIVSGSTDCDIILWDIATRREIRTFSGHTGGITSVTFSPDGRRVLSGSWDGTIKLWDTATGREIKNFSGHTNWVASVTFSPDGIQILSGGETAKLWDVSSGREIRTFSGHTEQVQTVAFSPDGRQALSGSYDKTIKLWDVSSGREIRTFPEHAEVNAVSFSPDGKYVLSGSGDTIKLWDKDTGREIRTFTGKVTWFSSIEFSPDGRQILFFDRETIKLLDVATGREIRTFQGRHDDPMLGVPTNFSPDVCFSPDGRQILSGFDYIILWDITTGREIKNFSGDIAGAGNISFNKDGRQILSGGNPIKIWDAVNGREIKTFSGYGEVVFSPDEKQILSVTGDTIKIWDAANGQEIKNLVGVNYASSAAFSPDGKQILSGGRPAQLWDAASGREIRNFPWNANWGLSFVSISPDGEQAIWGGWSTLELWDITTGREIRTFPVDVVCMIYSAVFSPDGKLILSGSENPAVKLWDTVTGYEIRTFIGHTDSVYSVVFSPDGRQALSGSGDKTIKLWDVATGREIMTFSGHASGVYSVVFSPDGKRVLSSSGDGTIRIWDIVTGKEIIQFISFFDGEWLAITPDGYYNASPRGDQYLNVRVGNNVYGIDQYRTTFYRPRIVEARLQGMPDPVYTAAAIQEAASFEPPLVVIRSPENGAGLTSGQTELSVSVVDRTQPIQSIRVVVNGRLVGGEALQGINGVRGGRLEATGIRLTEHQNRVDFQLPLSLDPGTNRIEVTANNPYSEGRDIVEVNYRAAAQNILPNLWILSIGINRYDDPLLQNLDYAVNDAKEIIDVFKAQEGKLYRTVHSLLIADGAAVAPTKDNIIDNFDFLKSAGQRDVALLFIAGHGMNDDGGRYYLMPSDAGFNADGSIRPSKAISYRDIQGVLDVPGQKLVFIDSCHSEGVSGRRTRGADNNQLVRELQDNSTVIFTASRGNQLSQERPELGHGVFTYAIIQGMMGEADLVKDGTVTMKELDTYVSEMVPRLTSGLQQPTTNTPEGYVNFVVADVR